MGQETQEFKKAREELSVWLTIPSARPAVEITARIQLWQRQGYRIALWRNGPHVSDPLRICNACGSSEFIAEDPAKCQACGSQDSRSLLTNRDALKATPEYAGWGNSINILIAEIMVYDPGAQWFVGGGDDTDPDQRAHADDIGMECFGYFYGSTFGVMQPTGDRWGESEPWAKHLFPDAPAYIDRICGSPWIGREFARRANQGKGPFWPECYHMFSDQILKESAEKLGILWQRRDLIHFHNHCRRDGVARTPEFLRQAYSQEEWQKSKAIYERLKASDFAECAPLPA